MSKPVIHLDYGNVQNLDFDLRAAVQGNIYGPHPVLNIQPVPEKEYIFGLIREVQTPVRATGTRREPQPYRFINGKREPNRRQRFGQK